MQSKKGFPLEGSIHDWADILQNYDGVADSCRKDSIAVEWNYEVLSSRSNNIKFYKNSANKITKDIYENELTKEQHLKFDKYLNYNSTSEDFSSLPMGPYLKDLGFEVITASNVNSVDNVKTHSEAAIQTPSNSSNIVIDKQDINNKGNGLLGNLATCWASANSDRQPYTIFEMISHILKNSSMDNNSNSSILLDFIKKISLEKELDIFKTEELAKVSLPETFHKKLKLLPYCNERFANREEIPGWSGIFENDLRFFPKGDVCFNGVSFYINPDLSENDKSVIMIGENDLIPSLPDSVKQIKTETKAYALNFLHGHVEGKPLSNGYYGKYILNYADGEKEEIPLFYNKNMGEWWRIVELEDASIAWSGENLKQVMTWIFNFKNSSLRSLAYHVGFNDNSTSYAECI